MMDLTLKIIIAAAEHELQIMHDKIQTLNNPVLRFPKACFQCLVSEISRSEQAIVPEVAV